MRQACFSQVIKEILLVKKEAIAKFAKSRPHFFEFFVQDTKKDVIVKCCYLFLRLRYNVVNRFSENPRPSFLKTVSYIKTECISAIL